MATTPWGNLSTVDLNSDWLKPAPMDERWRVPFYINGEPISSCLFGSTVSQIP